MRRDRIYCGAGRLRCRGPASKLPPGGARNAASPPRRSATRCSNLEARVGIRLLNRTTRSVSLTDAGATLLAQLSPAFGESPRRWSPQPYRDTPFGKVRINVPNSIAPFVLGPVIGP